VAPLLEGWPPGLEGVFAAGVRDPGALAVELPGPLGFCRWCVPLLLPASLEEEGVCEPVPLFGCEGGV
jgi:hypothetical protein